MRKESTQTCITAYYNVLRGPAQFRKNSLLQMAVMVVTFMGLEALWYKCASFCHCVLQAHMWIPLKCSGMTVLSFTGRSSLEEGTRYCSGESLAVLKVFSGFLLLCLYLYVSF